MLHKEMSELEILRHVAQTYADPSNWEEWEKDFGGGHIGTISPWITRDKGWYAQHALKMIKEKNSA